VQFPAIIGGVVPVVNIEGITPGQLKFTGAVPADICLGRSGQTTSRSPTSIPASSCRRT
jgi:phosphate transport system substrate-binding protein